MKNTQKGSVLVWVVVLIVIAGGIFLFLNNKSGEVKDTNIAENVLDTSTNNDMSNNTSAKLAPLNCASLLSTEEVRNIFKDPLFEIGSYSDKRFICNQVWNKVPKDPINNVSDISGFEFIIEVPTVAGLNGLEDAISKCESRGASLVDLGFGAKGCAIEEVAVKKVFTVIAGKGGYALTLVSTNVNCTKEDMLNAAKLVASRM